MGRLKTIIVGLGQIGALYDIDQQPQDAPRSHLGALVNNEDFEIVGLIDPDKDTVTRVQSHYSTQIPDNIYYSDIEGLPETIQIDVVVLAAPAHTRRAHIEAVLRLNPQFILIEKPVALSWEEAEEIKNLCAVHNVIALINFHRRYDPGHTNFQAHLPTKEIPEKIICHYSKGLMNYGSHAIDLLTHWFGSVTTLQAFNSNNAADPLLDGVLALENGTQIHLISHEETYDLFDFEFFYTDSKYILSHGGVEKHVQHSQVDRYYPDYTQLSATEELMPPQAVHGLTELYGDIVQKAQKPEHILRACTLEEAVKGLQIITLLVKSAAKQHSITV